MVQEEAWSSLGGKCVQGGMMGLLEIPLDPQLAYLST